MIFYKIIDSTKFQRRPGISGDLGLSMFFYKILNSTKFQRPPGTSGELRLSMIFYKILTLMGDMTFDS